jgi:hypothetical protein
MTDLKITRGQISKSSGSEARTRRNPLRPLLWWRRRYLEEGRSTPPGRPHRHFAREMQRGNRRRTAVEGRGRWLRSERGVGSVRSRKMVAMSSVRLGEEGRTRQGATIEKENGARTGSEEVTSGGSVREVTDLKIRRVSSSNLLPCFYHCRHESAAFLTSVRMPP